MRRVWLVGVAALGLGLGAKPSSGCGGEVVAGADDVDAGTPAVPLTDAGRRTDAASPALAADSGREAGMSGHELRSDSGEDAMANRPSLPAIAITAGTSHACAILSDTSARCWGSNRSGQLGNGRTNLRAQAPVEVIGLTGVAAMAAGDQHTCALLKDGSVWCWGENSAGELGDGTKTSSASPRKVTGVSDATAIAAAAGFTCALVGGGAVKCWGNDQRSSSHDLTATTIPGVLGASAIAARQQVACVVISGKVECWGSNESNQLGNPSVTYSHTPVDAVGITNAIAVSVGYFQTCALLETGRMKCWGQNGGPEGSDLGNGMTNSTAEVPESVIGIADAIAVAANGGSCALLSSGSVRCWGTFLGNGASLTTPTPNPMTWSTTPVEVHGVTDAVAIAAGQTFDCALRSRGSVDCWGWSLYPWSSPDAHWESTPVPVVW